MPIGNISREPPKRENYRPPWVKDKDAEAPPPWTQRKLKPVESKPEPKKEVEAPAEPAPIAAKTLKPALKKQTTIKDKTENGVASTEDKVLKPLAVKIADKPKAPEQKSKFAKSALKSIDKIPKLEEKLSKDSDKPEKPTLRTVRTIDEKPKEKSVTKVDRKPIEKNGTAKATNFVNDKTSKSTVNDKVTNKTNSNVKNNTIAIDKVPAKANSATNDKTAKSINEVKSKESESDNKPHFQVKLRPVPKPVENSSKAEDKSSEMAAKPPTKLPPRKPSLVKQPSKDDGPVKKWRDPLHERVKDNIDKTLANEIPKGHTLTKNESLRSLLKPAPPPMPPPLPPKMPPPPEFKKAPIDPAKLKKIEQLKQRPRRRPDWSDMMKEVEQGRKLKKVVCNDRSSPIITRAALVKNKDQFIFESEKPKDAHHVLLKEISQGIKLKKTKTNDRSKPNLEGLRKFRRQMTIEEQVQKSMSQANLAASPSGVNVDALAEAATEEEEIDEMDDIDKVRDDLQSTKQLLAIELRNKEAQEREKKRLQTRIQNLEAELARERAIVKQEQHKTVISVTDAYDERLVNNLKSEVERTKENADNLEKKYLEAAEERDTVITELEEVKRKNAELEKKLEQALANKFEDLCISEEPLSFYQKRQLEFEKQCRLLNIDVNSDEAHSLRKSAANNNLAYNDAYTNYENKGIMPTPGSRRSSHAIKQLSVTKDDSFEEESESDPEEEESEEKKQKRLEKEIRNTRNKMRHLKEKQDNMKRERMAYKMSLKNQQAALKEEKRKYKVLKREVDKMASMMKECGSDDEDEDEDEESEDSKKSESEEEETETETEQDTESETESESEPEDAPLPKKKENLAKRLKRHETRVNALKKGNALLMANVDRLKDDVLRQREESMALQKELDSLIEDLE